MISSAEEFKHLRESKNPQVYHRAAQEEASLEVWQEVLISFPEMAFWVAQNKTVPLEILEQLANNTDPTIRAMVARKRKLTQHIFNLLKDDPDESVRHALIWNTALSIHQKQSVNTTDSLWLKNELAKQIDREN